jgi:hypothetical protein
VKRLVAALTVLTVLVAVAVAQGEVVQQFSYQIKDIKTWGGYTVVFSSRSYDASGGIPAPLNENYQRLPKGAVVRKEFRNKRFYCDAKKLVDQLRMNKPANVRFIDFLNRTLRGKKVPPKSSKNLVAVCRFARIGSGSVLVDARPFVEPPIPAGIELFWTKPDKGAAATFAVVGIPDESAPIVRDNPTIRETRPVLNVSFYNDPTPDGLYQYKLVLPTGPIAGINISVEEVRVTVPGLTYVKKTCARRKRGRCVKRKTKRLFWFTQPTCPASGKLSFQAFYGYASIPDQTKTIEIPCPNFRR